MTQGRDQAEGLHDLGILDFDDLSRIARSSPRYVVKDLVMRNSVNIVVGDSGLGKTPLAVQAALSVAGNVPFLGRGVRSGSVLYCDAESGARPFCEMVRVITAHLGLPSVPDNFHVWSPNFSPAPVKSYLLTTALCERVRALRPDLVIVDPLRAFWSGAEEGAREAMHMVQDQRELSREVGCAWLNVHHPRKLNFQNPVSLDKDRWRWFQEAAGSRALINNTDCRLGVEATNGGNADLVVAGFARLVGYIETQFLERVCDDEGKPLGYRQLVGADFLSPRYRIVLHDLRGLDVPGPRLGLLYEAQ